MSLKDLVRPHGDRLVVRAHTVEEKEVSGLIIPEHAQKKPQTGVVIAVGTDVQDIYPDDTVLYAKHGGVEVEVGDEQVLVLRKADVYLTLV